MELTDKLVAELVDAVKQVIRKEASERLREVYLVGDIEKDSARVVIERVREMANDSGRPITLYLNTAGGNVTDGLAIHDAIREVVSRGVQVTIVVQGMAYSMGSVVLQAASEGRRLAFPHSWIMIHEPAKWAGWQSTTAAQQHLDRLRQMQAQIYRILAERSGKSLRHIIRDTKRTDLYLDSPSAKTYGLIDEVIGAGAELGGQFGSHARTSGAVSAVNEPGFHSAPAASESSSLPPDGPPIPDREDRNQ